MGDNGKIWADGEDPFADFRKTMERRFWVGMKHGKDTLEFFQAVKEEGLSIEGDEEKIRRLTEAKAAKAHEEDTGFITSSVHSDGRGGVEMRIEFDARSHKESGINAAIKSLGNREGEDPKEISKALKTALRERDLGLDEQTRLEIAALLAAGEEVTVGVQSGPRE